MQMKDALHHKRSINRVKRVKQATAYTNTLAHVATTTFIAKPKEHYIESQPSMWYRKDEKQLNKTKKDKSKTHRKYFSMKTSKSVQCAHKWSEWCSNSKWAHKVHWMQAHGPLCAIEIQPYIFITKESERARTHARSLAYKEMKELRDNGCYNC